MRSEEGVVEMEKEVEAASCECCGLTEECTAEYAEAVRGRFKGSWLCGLCGEAVKEEMARAGQRRIDADEALRRHLAFCRGFRRAPAPGGGGGDDDLIAAVRQLVRRGLESPRAGRAGEEGSPRSPFRGASFFSPADRLSLQS